MSIPSWFDPNAYFDNKLAATEGYNEFTLTKAFADAGFSGDEGLYEHFVRFGASEGLSPNSYFNVDEYLFAKAQDYFNTTAVSQNQIRSMFLAFENAGMTPWEHYLQYGAAEGINPSNSFDNDLYLAAKLAQLQADEPDAGWTLDALNQALTDGGLTPLTHYMAYGVNEDLGTSFLNTGNVGTTQYLTNGQDSLFGTSGGDYFEAGIGQLSTNDYIDGGSGFDTLKAVLGVSPDEIAIQPTILNVEKIIFQAQTNSGGGGSNANTTDGIEVSVDAGNISGMTMLQNSNSRASLVVEDVRTDSTSLTVSWVDADPGRDVDYEVYFNPQNLTTQTAAASGTINIQLMDVRNAQLSGGDTPLLNQPWENFTFAVIDSNGEAHAITLNLDSTKVTGAGATYDTLLAAFQEALAVADPNNLYQLSAAINGTFVGSASVGGENFTWTGEVITLTSANSSVSVNSSDYDFVGWSTNSGTTPPIGGIVWSAEGANETTCPLIQTNIDLDNVGRVQWGDAVATCLPDESWYGSEAGDMTVGSMANRGGVERFDVNVDRGSWISSLSSTNNTLRAVVVHDKDINGDGITGNVSSQSKESGDGESQLFIGRQLDADGSVHDQNLWGPSSWTDKAVLLSTDGLQDVKYFSVYDDNGTLSYTGNVNLGASITAASYDKYLKDVDGVDTTTENYAPNGAFQYTFGDKADILNLTVNSGVANDQDFYLRVSMGAGDDLVNFSYENGGNAITTNQIYNMAAQVRQENAMSIDAGDGNDIVKVWGDGAISVNGGAGNDALYVGQNAADQNAVFLFNIGNQVSDRLIDVSAVDGAQPLNNDIGSTVGSFSVTGTSGQTLSVVVTYAGISSTVSLVTLAGTSATLTAQQVNQAIAQAIENNEYLSDLFVAKDGAGYSLMVEALFDGVVDLADFGITFTGTASSAGLTAAYTTNEAYAVTAESAGTLTAAVSNGSVPAPATATTFDLTLTGAPLATLAVGQTLTFNIDNVTYTGTVGAGITDQDAMILSALANARSDAGVALSSIWTFADSLLVNDGIVTATSVSLNSVPVATVNATVDLAIPTNVTGTDTGTNSYNVVNGGAGNDTIVLNVNSDNTVVNGESLINVVELSGAIGNDVIVNFDFGGSGAGAVDLIDATAYNVDAALIASIATTAAGQTAATATEIVTGGAFNGLAGLDNTGLGFAQHGATNVYTVFQYTDANGDATVDANEVAILGTVTFVNSEGTFDLTDIDI